MYIIHIYIHTYMHIINTHAHLKTQTHKHTHVNQCNPYISLNNLCYSHILILPLL